MVIGSETRIKIRGSLTLLGFRRTGYTNVTEPGGEYSETWTDGKGESVVLTWGGYPDEPKDDERVILHEGMSAPWTRTL